MFDNRKIRTVWVEDEEEWYFSVKAIDYIQSPEELPFNTRDDIVWRGQLAHRWLESNSSMSGRFGDVDLTFEFVEY